jgi:hypothetical protein
MPPIGRSADDLPLAAYSTGVDPETEPDLDPVPATLEPQGSGTAAAYLAAPAFARPFGDGQAGGPFAANAPGMAAPDAGATPRTQPGFRDVLRNPRANLRDPRVLLSGVVAIGLVLLAVSLLGGGGGTGLASALASPSAPTGPVVTMAPVGDASIDVTGALTGTFALSGVTGTGRPAGTALDSTWGDTLGDVLALSGPVSSGTRMTDEGFVLTWTAMIGGKPVTFASKAGECTVGMAAKPTTVSGSFVCKKVKSADGKYVVGVRGTYRT